MCVWCVRVMCVQGKGRSERRSGGQSAARLRGRVLAIGGGCAEYVHWNTKATHLSRCTSSLGEQAGRTQAGRSARLDGKLSGLCWVQILNFFNLLTF